MAPLPAVVVAPSPLLCTEPKSSAGWWLSFRMPEEQAWFVYYLGLCRGFYRDNGKENGNYVGFGSSDL